MPISEGHRPQSCVTFRKSVRGRESWRSSIWIRRRRGRWTLDLADQIVDVVFPVFARMGDRWVGWSRVRRHLALARHRGRPSLEITNLGIHLDPVHDIDVWILQVT